jgi:hypothetical protein
MTMISRSTDRNNSASISAPPTFEYLPIAVNPAAHIASTSEAPSTIKIGPTDSRQSTGIVSPRRPPASIRFDPSWYRRVIPMMRPEGSHSGNINASPLCPTSGTASIDSIGKPSVSAKRAFASVVIAAANRFASGCQSRDGFGGAFVLLGRGDIESARTKWRKPLSPGLPGNSRQPAGISISGIPRQKCFPSAVAEQPLVPDSHKGHGFPEPARKGMSVIRHLLAACGGFVMRGGKCLCRCRVAERVHSLVADFTTVAAVDGVSEKWYLCH